MMTHSPFFNTRLTRLVWITFFLVNFLFYIDEGWYNFNWMKQPGNWVAFALYFFVLLGFQIGIMRLFVKSNFAVKWEYSSLLGIAIGLIGLFYVLG